MGMHGHDIPDEGYYFYREEVKECYFETPYPTWGSNGKTFSITKMSNNYLTNAYKYLVNQYRFQKIDEIQKKHGAFDDEHREKLTFHIDYMKMCLTMLGKERGILIDPQDQAYHLGFIKCLESELSNNDDYEDALELFLLETKSENSALFLDFEDGWKKGKHTKEDYPYFCIPEWKSGFTDCVKVMTTEYPENNIDLDYLNGWISAINLLKNDYPYNLSLLS